mgnify:CR=1 FL=1
MKTKEAKKQALENVHKARTNLEKVRKQCGEWCVQFEDALFTYNSVRDVYRNNNQR